MYTEATNVIEPKPRHMTENYAGEESKRVDIEESKRLSATFNQRESIEADSVEESKDEVVLKLIYPDRNNIRYAKERVAATMSGLNDLGDTSYLATIVQVLGRRN